MKTYTIDQSGTKLDSECGDDCSPCALPVYDPGCESTGPVCPDQPGCPPEPCVRFNARMAIRVRQEEIERLFDFSLYTESRTDAWVRTSMRMYLKRVGDCRWQWDMCALSVTPSGDVRFRWPSGFLSAPPGYYEGGLMVNGAFVDKRLYFYKPFMTVNVNSTTAVMQDCHEPCSAYETQCCVPDLETPARGAVPVSDCGGCDD